jgi:hypothetical protein
MSIKGVMIMMKNKHEKRYKFAAICFGLAAFAFLSAGILSGNRVPFLVLTVLFTVNSILYYSQDKKKNRQQ